MNLSSLIIRVKHSDAELLQQKLRDSGLCECHLYENGKLIVTIEGNNTGEELDKINVIKQNREVISIDMIYAYSESELEQARSDFEKQPIVPEWLNIESIEAKEIKYSGKI